jgi:tRNA uridine 5-carboxymethylaminomethyl modification enzyme
VRFAEKPSHLLFLEPEGWHTREVYVQGANTSLPEDVQLAMLRSIPALEHCEIMRSGYAIEYDYLPGRQVTATLESNPCATSFWPVRSSVPLGTRRGALGIMAGINAARRARDEEGVVLRRDQAYIGVLIDDLVTREMDEPYRMHTSQAEFRLLLRQDNAEQRLSGLAYDLGLIDEARHVELQCRDQQVRDMVQHLDSSWLHFNEETTTKLEAVGCLPSKQNVRAGEFLCRSDVRIDLLQALGLVPADLPDEVAREVETVVKYAGYVSRQQGRWSGCIGWKSGLFPGRRLQRGARLAHRVAGKPGAGLSAHGGAGLTGAGRDHV